MIFLDIVDLCVLLQKESSRNSKKILLKNFFTISRFDSLIVNFVEFITLSLNGENAIFNLDEIELSRIISDFCGITLQQFIIKNKEIGDIGTTFSFFSESKNICIDKPMDFSDIVTSFESIKNIKGKKSREEKKDILFGVFSLLSPLERCFYVRFFVGKLRIGLSDSTVLDVLSEMAIEDGELISLKKLQYLFGVCNNLSLITRLILTKDYDQLNQLGPQLFQCIQPQAAELYIKEKKNIFSQNIEFFVQPKIDGFRLQAHVNKDSAVLFSRNCLVVTEMFFELIDHLKKICFQNNLENIIFDGEVIAYNTLDNSLLSFEHTAQRKKTLDAEQSTQVTAVKYIIFDLLFCNNMSFLSFSYENRLKELEKIQLPDKKIQCIETHSISTEANLQQVYSDAIYRGGYEGVMIKDPQSAYEPGKRSHHWLKYKEVQKDSLEDLFDLVVLGINFAKGNRKKNQDIGSLLVGVFNPVSDLFETVAQVGAGGNVQLWQMIHEKLKEHTSEVGFPHVKIEKKHTPDLFVYPKLIISVKADKVTRSKEHSFGYSIRFPRVVLIREDKNEYQTNFPFRKE
jgi:DNA ligase-1